MFHSIEDIPDQMSNDISDHFNSSMRIKATHSASFPEMEQLKQQDTVPERNNFRCSARFSPFSGTIFQVPSGDQEYQNWAPQVSALGNDLDLMIPQNSPVPEGAQLGSVQSAQYIPVRSKRR